MLQMEKTTNIFDSIETNLGEKCIWSNYKKKLPPIYSNNFNFAMYSSKAKQFVLIIPKSQTIDSTLIRGVASQVSPNPHIYVENKSLIKDISTYGIPYFDCHGVLHNSVEIKAFRKISYTKATQLVGKYLLLTKETNMSTRQIASFLGISNTSVQRAYDYLESIGAVTREGGFTSTVSYSIVSRKSIFDCIKNNMINPIKNYLKMFIKRTTIDKFKNKFIKGAEEVLTNVTDLDSSSIIEYVIDSETYIELLFSPAKYRSYDGELTYIEEWIYRPDLLSDGKSIDIIDAYIVLKNRYSYSNDPRINKALKEMERIIISGKD